MKILCKVIQDRKNRADYFDSLFYKGNKKKRVKDNFLVLYSESWNPRKYAVEKSHNFSFESVILEKFMASTWRCLVQK